MSHVSRVAVSFKAVANLGNFESAHCEITVEKTLDANDDPNREMEKLAKYVKGTAKAQVLAEIETRKGAK